MKIEREANKRVGNYCLLGLGGLVEEIIKKKILKFYCGMEHRNKLFSRTKI